MYESNENMIIIAYSETPEIGLQEEEEPVKVEVETTTVWNGHTEQPRGDNPLLSPSHFISNTFHTVHISSENEK